MVSIADTLLPASRAEGREAASAQLLSGFPISRVILLRTLTCRRKVVHRGKLSLIQTVKDNGMSGFQPPSSLQFNVAAGPHVRELRFMHSTAKCAATNLFAAVDSLRMLPVD